MFKYHEDEDVLELRERKVKINGKPIFAALYKRPHGRTGRVKLGVFDKPLKDTVCIDLEEGVPGVNVFVHIYEVEGVPVDEEVTVFTDFAKDRDAGIAKLVEAVQRLYGVTLIG